MPNSLAGTVDMLKLRHATCRFCGISGLESPDDDPCPDCCPRCLNELMAQAVMVLAAIRPENRVALAGRILREIGLTEAAIRPFLDALEGDGG